MDLRQHRQEVCRRWDAIARTHEASALREAVLITISGTIEELDARIDAEDNRFIARHAPAPVLNECEQCGRDRDDEACAHWRTDILRGADND